ncbi:MAG: hypothetical protein HY645_00775 [Acidobacteria bacterium]|nr:hypothetical protein [Acidobacteriota bacterium]
MRLRYVLKYAFLAMALATAFLAPGFSQDGQKEAEGQQDVEYTPEEYDAYEAATSETDPLKKEDAIIAFLKASPQSGLVQYAVGSYLQNMQQYQAQGKLQEVARAGEKLLALYPTDLNALNMTTFAYYQTRQFDKAVKYGEAVYEKNPSGALAFVLANSYGVLKNDDKVLLYGEKACAELAPKDCYPIMAELTRMYASREQWDKAGDFAKKTIDTFESLQKPPETPDAEWQDYVSKQKAISYAILGRQEAEKERWSAAIGNYEMVLKTYANPALHAEAYYFIGRGQWKQERLDPAMEAFARGSLQPSAPYAKPCRQYLETLYKSTHNDSLAGLDEFIQRVSGK